MVSVDSSVNNQPMTKPYRLSWKELGEYRNDQMNKMIELNERLGRVAHTKFLWFPVTFICDPEVIREVLVRNANNLHKDQFTTHIFRRILGEGILIAEDETWQQQRKLLQPVFHATHIQDFADTFKLQAKEMCDSWNVGSTVQLEQEMMELTLRIICRTMFSEDIDGLISEISQTLKVMVGEAQWQLRFGLRLPSWIPLPTYRRQDRAIKEIHELLLTIIRKRQAQLQREEEVPMDLLTMLLTAQYEDGHSMSDTQVLGECMTIFFAGHETTAVGLTWTWIELLQHPDILQRLTQEVDDKLAGRPVAYNDVAEMPYLSQVIKEAMRLHPPAAALAREVISPFEVNGHHFKPKDTLAIAINTMHHREEFYPEPYRFNPDRFAPDKEQPDRYTYMPFGAGSRICIGNAFATLEMQIVLATMIQSLRLSLVPDQEFVPEQLITLRPRDGVKVRVEKKI